MGLIQAGTIASMAGVSVNSNIESVVAGLDRFGANAGLSLPHRLAQYLPQLIHESGRFVYDREVWGPTPAQARYDTRTDLGNTAAADGDGYRLRGRSGIQLTGGTNYRNFTAWAKSVDPEAPDFFAEPDLVNTDPWEGAVPIWYWSLGNPEGVSLNKYADTGNIEMVTRRINGGLNGYADRLKAYDRCALILIGYGPRDVLAFQKSAGLSVDGISGPQTRAALHNRLKKMPALGTRPVHAKPDETNFELASDALDAIARVVAEYQKARVR